MRGAVVAKFDSLWRRLRLYCAAESTNTFTSKDSTAEAAQAAAAAEDQPPMPDREARLPWKALTWLTIGLAFLVAMGEISRLSGSILDTAAQAWSFNDLVGFWSLPSRDGWLADFSVADDGREILLNCYLAVDLACLLVYSTLIARFLSRRFDGRVLRNGALLLLVLATADFVEDVLAFIIVDLDLDTPALGPLSWVVAIVNTVKSLACLAVAFLVVWGLLTTGDRTARESVKLIYQLTRQHRFTVVPLALLALVSITPGADILDQVPDIVRKWTDGPLNFLQGGLAVIALLLFAATLFMIGRMRTAVAARAWDVTNCSWRKDQVKLGDAPLLPWFTLPLGLFIVGLLASVLGLQVGLIRLGCSAPYQPLSRPTPAA